MPVLKVFNPGGSILHEQTQVENGQYAFTTKQSGDFSACFERAKPREHSEHTKQTESGEGEHSDSGEAPLARVRLEWQTGVSTTDWESIASADNVKAMSRALEGLENETRRVHDNLQNLRQNEERMRNMNESTNSMVTWFALFSLGVCFSLSAWQVSHLKNFFGALNLQLLPRMTEIIRLSYLK